MSVTLLLIIAFGSPFLVYFCGKISSGLRDGLAVVLSLVLTALVALMYGQSLEETFYAGFLGLSLIIRLNMLSWLFAIAITTISTLALIFSLQYIRGKERTDFYYLIMLLVNAGMLGIVLSGDFVSFYIFWEIMSFSAFLLISYNRGAALAAGMKYIIMSLAGSVAMLVGILSLYASFGTLLFSELAVHMSVASTGYIVFILILFCSAFGIKNAIIPFHPWLPPAHSEAPSPFSAVLSGILIKMGTYGFVLLLYVVIGLETFLRLSVFQSILNILAAITILIPTFIALLQNDAKRLLAWSTVGQAGYIILGIAFGTSLSMAGGLFHFLNHATFKALLFLAVGAVEYRTNGVRDLNSLGGLIKRMPITFIAVLIGTCGVIGVPLTNGFVSKWFIYKTLILEGSPFLAFAALFGTWGTILYSYKLIHHVFLGQLPEQYTDIKRAPFSMGVPMGILSFAILLFGVLPGIPLHAINAIGESFGFASLEITIWGTAAEVGVLNTVNIFAAMLVVGLIVWIIFKAGPKVILVSQEDTYAAGAAIPKERYQYTVDFYNPLERMISPYLKDVVDEFYMRFAGWIRGICNGVRRIYTGDVGYYVIYIILFLATLIFVQLNWSVW